MAFSFTSDDLLSSIKVRGRVPTSQSTFSDAKLRKLCDEEIAVGILPKLLKARQNYLMCHTLHSITDGVTSYRIPARAIGGKLNSVILIDNSGNEQPVSQIAYQDRGYYVQNSTNTPVYYIDNSSVILVPAPSTTDQYSLRLTYYIRPNSLVAVSAAAKITDIDTATKQVTVSATPTTMSDGVVVDFVKGDGGFECPAIDQTVVTVASNVFTFSATLPDGLAVGDYVALAGETPIPQIPAELHPVLSLRVAKVILQSLGFQNELKECKDSLKEAEANTEALLVPRVDSSPKKINARNSLLRRGSWPY